MAAWVTTSQTADGRQTIEIFKYKLYLVPTFISILHHSYLKSSYLEIIRYSQELKPRKVRRTS